MLQRAAKQIAALAAEEEGGDDGEEVPDVRWWQITRALRIHARWGGLAGEEFVTADQLRTALALTSPEGEWAQVRNIGSDPMVAAACPWIKKRCSNSAATVEPMSERHSEMLLRKYEALARWVMERGGREAAEDEAEEVLEDSRAQLEAEAEAEAAETEAEGKRESKGGWLNI